MQVDKFNISVWVIILVTSYGMACQNTPKHENYPQHAPNATSEQKDTQKYDQATSIAETPKPRTTSEVEPSDKSSQTPTHAKENTKKPSKTTTKVAKTAPSSVAYSAGVVEEEPPINTNLATKKEEQSGTLAKPNHNQLAALLQKYVSKNGSVDYAGLQTDAKNLDEYLATLATLPPNKDWSRHESMAFWINIYNAATLQLIINHYPLQSILDLDGGKTWDVKRIKVGEKTLSLNEIEHDILRKKYKDARIHFAVNCAARSCPPLLNDAFSAQHLDAQLHAQTKAFANNKNYNTLTNNKLELSKIFEWYKDDFGDVVAFLQKYTSSKIAPSATVLYEEYNWQLNQQ